VTGGADGACGAGATVAPVRSGDVAPLGLVRPGGRRGHVLAPLHRDLLGEDAGLGLLVPAASAAHGGAAGRLVGLGLHAGSRNVSGALDSPWRRPWVSGSHHCRRSARQSYSEATHLRKQSPDVL